MAAVHPFSGAAGTTSSAAARDRWIVERRGPRAVLDPWQPYAAVSEVEPDADGSPRHTAVVFLTNRECPFRCVMCDLWVNTLTERVPAGAIPAQIRGALARLASGDDPRTASGFAQIKLYNAGSFFDPAAIPPDDDQAIAAAVASARRIVVESHPAFLDGRHGDRALAFRDRLNGDLEVAIGLETAHPDVLARLNKRMTLADFSRAAAFLQRHAIGLRVFILLRPPFMDEDTGLEWACRSIDVAIDAGAAVCVVIPTRGGNGAMEALGAEAAPPRLASLERAVEYGIARGRCRVFADLWDVPRLAACACADARIERLRTINREQRLPPPIACACDA